jgi:hypothetical protein
MMADGTLTWTGGEQAVAPTPHFNDVRINKAANGFIVYVGCKVLVAKTWKEVSDGLALYFKDPAAAQKKYCKE